MFFGCSSLKELPDISKWKINSALFLNGMFMECSSLEKFPDISNWKIVEKCNKDIIVSFVELYISYNNIFINLEFTIDKINDFIKTFCQLDFKKKLLIKMNLVITLKK